jgi:hypothetical protein
MHSITELQSRSHDEATKMLPSALLWSATLTLPWPWAIIHQYTGFCINVNITTSIQPLELLHKRQEPTSGA